MGLNVDVRKDTQRNQLTKASTEQHPEATSTAVPDSRCKGLDLCLHAFDNLRAQSSPLTALTMPLATHVGTHNDNFCRTNYIICDTATMFGPARTRGGMDVDCCGTACQKGARRSDPRLLRLGWWVVLAARVFARLVWRGMALFGTLLRGFVSEMQGCSVSRF